MAKIALLIGVSDYPPGLKPLPSTIQDAKAMAEVLKNENIGGFDEVKILSNPGIIEMSTEIQIAFNSNRHKNDLIVLFFSGHGIKDERTGELYLSSHDTGNTPQGDFNKATAVRSSFLHELMETGLSKRQVVILDCCFGGAFVKGMIANSGNNIYFRQLGREGRAILASSSAMPYSFENQGSKLSIYTQYLVEGRNDNWRC